MKIILIILLFYLNLSFSQVNLDSINFKKNKEHIDLDKTSEENILYDSLLESLEKNDIELSSKLMQKYIQFIKDSYGSECNEFYEANLLFSHFLLSQGKLFEAQKIINDIFHKLNSLKINHEILIKAYFALAHIQLSLYQLDVAENSAVSAMKILEENNEENSPSYVFCLSLISDILLNKKIFNGAEYFLEKAITINLNLKEGGIDNDLLYLDLIPIYQKNNKCEKAEEILIKLNFNYLNRSNKKKLWYAYNVYDCLNNYSKQYDYLMMLLNRNKESIIDFLKYMNNYEIASFLNSEIDLNSISIDFLIKYPNVFPDLNINIYEHELLTKNILLRNSTRINKSILSDDNFELIEVYRNYIKNRRKLVKLIESDYYDSVLINDLILRINEDEKYLIKNSKSFSIEIKKININWKKLIDKINDSKAIITIQKFNKNNTTPFYGAFIVNKYSKFPKFISLFEEKQLAHLLGKDKNQQDSRRIDEQYLNKQLSELILKPLENELKGISTIYLSLSGLTHQINVAALPINENQTFGQKYKIHILNSPSELMDYKSITFDKKDKLDFILYGNIDYDKRNIKPNKDSLDNQDFVNVDEEIKDLQTRSGISNFGYLSGTKNEIQNISTLTNKSDFKAFIFEDRNATEESIKQLDGRTTPFVLHLATHGFFFPDPVIEMSNEFLIEGKSKVFKTSDNPMMRSGLVFSGANKSWGKVNDNQSGDDGILSASEISNLDLSACELVVLSACETGLGEVKGSEGVFGLQRAFKMAGVKNIIMSLWKVPDAQTAELFDTFYSECFEGKTIHEAFHSAQAKMKAKYSPYYWAGFVLLE